MMGLEVLKKALAYRAVQWGRIYNQNYDMAVFVNDHIGGAIIACGKYEKPFLEMTVEALAELTHGEGFKEGTCLDVGANIGNHALFYGTIFKRVIAFEPNPIAYKLLEANVLKNRITNIDICTVALGAKKEKKVLSICNENLGMSSLVQEATANDPSLNIEISIDVGDDLIKKLVDDQSSISFIKLDVEGFEAEALEGLRQTILKHRPVIAIELNFHSLNEPAEDALKVLLSLGYKDFYILDSSHSIRNRYLNFVYRIIFGEKFVLLKLKELEAIDYQQIYCVSAA
jgi:FkbM family methyltransferase